MTNQLTIQDFIKDYDLQQRPDEDFLEWLERVKDNPNYYKLFIKKKEKNEN